MPPSVFRVKMCSFDADQRPGVGVQDAVRGGDPAEPVTEDAPGVADALHLGVLAERVGHLQIAGLDLGADAGRVQQRLVGQGVHLRDEFFEVVGDDEVGAVALERLDRARGVLVQEALLQDTCMRLLPVMSGFCSEPDSANSFLMIFWVRMNQEWSYCAMSGVVRRCRRVPRVS